MPCKTQLEWGVEPDCCCLIGIYLGRMGVGKDLAGSVYPSCSYWKASSQSCRLQKMQIQARYRLSRQFNLNNQP